MRDVVKLIEDAIGTPVLQTREEIARVEALGEMRVENEVIDALDALFEPTLGESWGESDGESRRLKVPNNYRPRRPQQAWLGATR